MEISQARSSGAGAANPKQLQEALAQALKESERAATAEQQALALQASLDGESIARSEAEARAKKSQELADGIQAKFMKLAEISKTLRSQNEDMLGQIETLKAAAGKSQQGADSGAAELKTLHSKLTQATSDITAWKQKHNESEARIKVLDNEIGTLNAKLKASQDAVAKSSAGASNASASSAAQLASVEAELKETRTQRDKALADAKALDEKFTGLMPKIQADRERSKGEIQALTDQATKLQADLTEATGKLRTSEAAARTAKSKFEELQVSNKSAGADSEKLAADLEKSKALLNKLRDELTASKTYVATLEDRVAKAQAQAQQARTDAAGSAGSSGGGNQAAVEQLKTENASLRDRLTAADSKANQLRREVGELRDQLTAGGGSAAPAAASPRGGFDAPPPPAAPVFDGGAGGPPPPPAGGPPPPPPPPPAGGAKSGGPLVITRSAKSTAALASSAPSSGGGPGDAQNALLAAISGGVKLKKSNGPEDTEAKLKRLESQRRAEAPKGPTGNPLADLSQLGMMAKELALKRTARVQATKETPAGRSRHDPARQSVRLTNLLDGM